MIAEHDTVVLRIDIPDKGLEAGDIGAVVHVYNDGRTLEVEFVTGEGRTIGVETVAARDVRTMGSGDILHVRELKAA